MPDCALFWCPWQSGQAYYINDGESVNLFEWMAPLVGAQMPTPPPLSPSSFPTSKTSHFICKTSSGNSVHWVRLALPGAGL